MAGWDLGKENDSRGKCIISFYDTPALDLGNRQAWDLRGGQRSYKNNNTLMTDDNQR